MPQKGCVSWLFWILVDGKYPGPTICRLQILHLGLSLLSFHERMWLWVGPIFYNEEKLLMKYYFFQFNIFAGIKIVWMSQFLKGRNLKDWAIQRRYHKDLAHMRQFQDCWNTFVSVLSHRTIFPQRKQTISLAFDTSTLWILDQ